MNDAKPSAPSASLNFRTIEQAPRLDYIELLKTFPYRPTLFIGLGGTGCKAVSKLKQTFTQVFGEVEKPEGQTETIPSMFAFRAFETNLSEQHTGNLTRNQELFYLCVKDVRRFLTEYGDHAFYRNWLPESLNAEAITAGAQGYRTLGRLALTYNMDVFGKAITTARNQIMQADPRLTVTQPIVYIFCSLAGGTGSGMFLDACFYLRENFPDVALAGFVALLEGVPSASSLQQRNAKIGGFAALKELNAFMSRNVPVPECAIDNVFPYPIGRVRGRYTKPFDYCFLVSSHNADAKQTLGNQDQVASFLSRCAFVLTAYSFDTTTTPDFYGILIDRKDELDAPKRGTRPCFIVPALGQIHFPLDEVVDWLCLKISSNLLRYLGSGQAYAGDDDAQAFARDNRLRRSELENLVKKTDRGAPLVAGNYEEELKARFRRQADVYKQGEALLSYGNNMLTRRLAELRDKMRPAQDKCLEGIIQALWNDAAARLVNEKYLYAGTQDFLTDLRNIVATELGNLVKHDTEQLEPRCRGIKANWEPLKRLLKDVATASSPVDRLRDCWRRRRCQDWYVNFLNESESALFDKACNDSVVHILGKVQEEIDRILGELKRLYDTHVQGAIGLIDEKREKIAVSLLDQERARGDRPEDILSINAITEEARDQWLTSKGEFSPQSVLAALCQGGWTPLKWLEEDPSRPRREPKERTVAQDTVDRVNPQLQPWRNRSLADILGETRGLRGTGPIDYLADTINTLAQPQMLISQKSVLGFDAEPICIVGGIDDPMAGELKQHAKFQNISSLNRARSYERHRITFFAAHLPVASASMTDLESVYKREYRHWLDECRKMTRAQDKKMAEEEIGLFHCFPGSATVFPDPSMVRPDISRELELFAKAMALSGIFPVEPRDLEQMRKRRGPRERLYALFRVGRSDFWLWPFVRPFDGQDWGKDPVNLGSNIESALKKFEADETCKDAAANWVNWYEAGWSTHFTEAEAAQKIVAVIQDLPTTDTSPERTQLWADVRSVLKQWAIEKWKAPIKE